MLPPAVCVHLFKQLCRTGAVLLPPGRGAGPVGGGGMSLAPPSFSAPPASITTSVTTTILMDDVTEHPGAHIVAQLSSLGSHAVAVFKNHVEPGECCVRWCTRWCTV